MRDKITAFICGDISVTLLHMSDFFSTLGDFGLKLGSTLLLGVVGGIAGMIGKNVYNITIVKYKNRKSKKP